MNEGYVKVSWENNAKTGEVENVVIDTEASATEEATAACLMMRHGAFCRMQRCLSIRCMNVGSAALAVSAARLQARNGMRSSDAGLLTRSYTYKPLTGCLTSVERAVSWTETG